MTYCLQYGKVIESIYLWIVEQSASTPSCSHVLQLRSTSRPTQLSFLSKYTASLCFMSCLGYLKWTLDDILLETTIVHKNSQAWVAQVPYTQDAHLTVSDPSHIKYSINILAQKFFLIHQPGFPTDSIALLEFKPLQRQSTCKRSITVKAQIHQHHNRGG